MSEVLSEIESERRKQVDFHGFGADHDDGHSDGELAEAAVAFIKQESRLLPWMDDPESGMGDRRRCLVKAAALLVAEIERIDRIASKESP